MMSSPTGTLDGHAVPRRRGLMSKLLLVLLVAGGSGVLTFGIVRLAGGKKEKPAQVADGAGADGVLAPPIDAGVPVAVPRDAAIAVAVVIDAAAAPPAPLDAAPAAPDAKPATSTRSSSSSSSSSRSSRSQSKAQGTLAVRAFPALTVYVNGKRFGDTPRDIKLSVGKHTLQLRNPASGHNEKVSVEILENKTTTIERM